MPSSLYFTSVRASLEMAGEIALNSGFCRAAVSASSVPQSCSLETLCMPFAAFRPRILVSASTMRSSLIIPEVYALSIVSKSSAGSLKNRNISQPALIAAGSISVLFMRLVIPTMWDASVTTIPLKPNSPRSRSVMMCLFKVAGIMVSAVISGSISAIYSGIRM